MESTIRVQLLHMRRWSGRRLEVRFLTGASSGLPSCDDWRRNVCLKRKPTFCCHSRWKSTEKEFIQYQLTGAAETMKTNHDSRVGRIMFQLSSPVRASQCRWKLWVMLNRSCNWRKADAALTYAQTKTANEKTDMTAIKSRQKQSSSGSSGRRIAVKLPEGQLAC